MKENKYIKNTLSLEKFGQSITKTGKLKVFVDRIILLKV